LIIEIPIKYSTVSDILDWLRRDKQVASLRSQ
jgi:hypothetical protein